MPLSRKTLNVLWILRLLQLVFLSPLEFLFPILSRSLTPKSSLFLRMTLLSCQFLCSLQCMLRPNGNTPFLTTALPLARDVL